MEKNQYKELVMPGALRTDDSREELEEITSVREVNNEDNRTSRRNRVLMSADIKFDENFASIKCVIRNISDDGALLKITDTNAVPNSFRLQIPMQGTEVECQIVDQVGHQIRVKFMGEKSRLRSRKTQYIDATSTVPEGSIDHHQAMEIASQNNAARSTKSLVSSFRQKNNNTE